MNRRLAVALCFAGIFVAVAPVAHADWTRVTSPSPGTQTGQASLLRTTDGVLHVVWRSDVASYRHRIDHRQVAVDGSLGPVTPVVRDWLELSDPALTLGPDGLRAIFGGLHSSHPDETNTELNTALSVDNGATWGLQDGSIAPAGSGATDAPVGAAAQGDGAPLAAWANGAGTWIHKGLDPAVPPANIQAPLGPYGTSPGVAAVGNRTVVAWFSYSGSGHGVYTQEVGPDGAAVGAPVQMPQTSSTSTAMPGRTPVASRVGGKVFVAYAAGSGASRRILLWSVGSASARVVARASGPAVATVTADGAGRVWVVWSTRVDGRDRVKARRSNATGTSFGRVIDASRPPNGARARTLDANAAGDDLDVVAGYSRSGSSRVTSYYSRVAGA